jgi:hypothetical protein
VVTVRLSIEPRFLGPASVGTVEIVKLVKLHAGVSLTEAKGLVDSCVFDGQSVAIAMSSLDSAEAFIRAISLVEGPAKVQATMENGA